MCFQSQAERVMEKGEIPRLYLHHCTISGSIISFNRVSSFLLALPTVVCSVADCCLVFPLFLCRASPSHMNLLVDTNLPQHISFWLAIVQGHHALFFCTTSLSVFFSPPPLSAWLFDDEYIFLSVFSLFFPSQLLLLTTTSFLFFCNLQKDSFFTRANFFWVESNYLFVSKVASDFSWHL